MSTAPIFPQLPPADSVEELVTLLAELAKAQGSAFYEAQHGKQTLALRAKAGTQPPDLNELRYEDLEHLKLRKHWAALPVYADGLILAILIMVFRDEPERLAAKPTLKRIAPLYESLVRFISDQDRQRKIAAKITELETEIAAEKILERAKGLLRDHPQLTEATIDLLDRHAAKVLASRQFGEVLQTRLRELENLAAERDITARAKAVLQDQGLSEEKAYLHLRTLSRQRRRRIAEIAREIVKHGGVGVPGHPQVNSHE